MLETITRKQNVTVTKVTHKVNMSLLIMLYLNFLAYLNFQNYKSWNDETIIK